MRDLNVKQIEALTKPSTYRVSKNLYLQIGPTATKAWLFRYMLNGRSHGIGLGSLDLVTLAEAREEALLLRKKLFKRADPLEERRSERAQARLQRADAHTFRECAEKYITTHSKGWRNGKHRQQWRNTLETYAYPVIGDLPVAAIDTGLIIQIVEPLWVGTPDAPPKVEAASRLRGRLEAILDWAKSREWREGENPARWRGHLDKLLPKRSKVAPVNHHSAWPYVDMPALMAELRKRKGIAAQALEFTILTAARTGEAIEAQWSEVDLDARTWTVPAVRMKAGKAHVVPLSDRVLEILEAIAPDPADRDGYVFENGRAGKPISNMAMAMLLRDMGRGDITVHGFRSTFKDWASEQTRHADIVSEMALAHTIPDKVQKAYRRGDLLKKRRALMRDWARYCAG